MTNEPGQGARLGRALVLTILLVTAIILFGLAGTAASQGSFSSARVALIVSTFLGAAAAVAMLGDAFDLWMLGRRMASPRVRVLRWMVFAAVLVALALTLLGQNTLLFLIMTPALVAYLFVIKSRPGTARAGQATADASRGRQRRGGRKRRS